MRQQRPTVPMRPLQLAGPNVFARGFEAARQRIKVMQVRPLLLQGMEQVA